MEIINFIENHWKLISFLKPYNKKEQKQITKWQFESIEKSYKLYKFFNGNSFVENLVERVEEFEIID